MMNTILVSKKFPKLWRKSNVTVILKPRKYSSLPKRYRPISLLCHTYTYTFERMIRNRLNPITEHTIIREQAGFGAVKSCTSQLMNLTQYIEDGYKKRLTTDTVFVDLSAAYYTLNHRLQRTKLYGMTEDAEDESDASYGRTIRLTSVHSLPIFTPIKSASSISHFIR